MRLEKGELRIEDWEFKFEDGGLRIKEGNIKIWGFHHAISTINTHITGTTLSRVTIFWGHSKSQNFLLENNLQQVCFLDNICSGDICPGQKLLDQNSSWINFTLGAKCILTNLFWDQHVFDQNPAIETCPYYSKAYSIWTYSG